MLAKRVLAQVNHEIELIGKHFVAYRELLESARQVEPNLIEITALASVLHSFYTIPLEREMHLPISPPTIRNFATAMLP